MGVCILSIYMMVGGGMYDHVEDIAYENVSREDCSDLRHEVLRQENEKVASTYEVQDGD